MVHCYIVRSVWVTGCGAILTFRMRLYYFIIYIVSTQITTRLLKEDTDQESGQKLTKYVYLNDLIL